MCALSLNNVLDKVLSLETGSGDPESTVRLAIFLDESVSPQMAQATKIAFRPVSPNALMHVEAFYSKPLDVHGAADLTVILAGDSPCVNVTYNASKAKGIPTVIIADNLAALLANEQGAAYPIDPSDVIGLKEKDDGISIAEVAVDRLTRVGRDVGQGALQVFGQRIPKAFGAKPLISSSIALRKPQNPSPTSRYAAVFLKLGDWICANCQELAGTMSNCFEFVRPSFSKFLTRRTAIENAGIAALFFRSKADFPVMTLNQIKMLLQIDRAHGSGLSKNTLYEAGALVAGAMACKTASKVVSKALPAFKVPADILIAFLGTSLMGHYANMYNEGGRQVFVEVDPNDPETAELLAGPQLSSIVNAIGAKARGIGEGGADLLKNVRTAIQISDIGDRGARIADAAKGFVTKGAPATVKKLAGALKDKGSEVLPSKTAKFANPARIVFHKDGSVDGLEALEKIFIDMAGDQEAPAAQ
ncbi:MAG: hypothetical protein IKE61_06200 [Coriobacteriales bacterium]|nr:hypothetical protein [Coriobacteriales bacterium]